MIFVGDDWAEDHHDVHVMDEAGLRLSSRRLPEGLTGIGQLHALIASHAEEPDHVVIGIETDRGLWVEALVAAGYQVFAINPLAVVSARLDVGVALRVVAELTEDPTAKHDTKSWQGAVDPRGTQRIPRIIGTAKALEHMLEGAPLTAEQELELGLINAIVPDAELVTHAQQTAARLARRSPVAVQAIKRLTYFNTSEPLDTGLDSELAGFIAAGLRPAMKSTLEAFAADMSEFNDSPLSIGAPSWINGTRIDQTT